MGHLGGHGKEKYVTGTQLGTSHDLGWEGILAERWHHSEGELGEVQVRNTEILVLLQGQLAIRRRGDGKLLHSYAVPGTAYLNPHGVHEDMIRLYGEIKESLHLVLPAAPLSQTMLREIDVDPSTVQLHFTSGFRDPMIAQIAWTIHAEMTNPTPAGKVLVETLAAALGIRLVQQYSNKATASIPLPRARGALDPRRLQRVTDFIEVHLDRNLSLAALAKEACLSPFHFSRAFKAATGIAPHRYLTNRRIERAKTLIGKGKLPFAEIANKCGFASLPHLIRGFKQFVGTTPDEFCRLSGLKVVRDKLDRKTIDVTTGRYGDVLFVNAAGHINETTTSTFTKAVRKATKGTYRAVILDLGKITFIDGSGLQAILMIMRALESQNTRLVLCAPSAPVLEQIKGTILERILQIRESRTQAFASLFDGCSRVSQTTARHDPGS